MGRKLERLDHKYTIGSDPEIFVKDLETGNISSVIGLLGGTKDEPIDIGEGCFVQEDNILSEFNIPPVNNLEDFKEKINYSKDYIDTVMALHGKTLHFSSSEVVNDEILKDKKALVFGCSPSFNVVNEEISTLEVSKFTKEEKLIRSCGFHIHIGYDNPNDEWNDRLVMCFELFVTLMLIESDNDKYNRRLLYGKIGDSRSKTYGVECRSLGGYFLKDDESLTIVWNQIQKALQFCEESEVSNDELRACLLDVVQDGNINLENLKLVYEHLEIKETINI